MSKSLGGEYCGGDKLGISQINNSSPVTQHKDEKFIKSNVDENTSAVQMNKNRIVDKNMDSISFLFGKTHKHDDDTRTISKWAKSRSVAAINKIS